MILRVASVFFVLVTGLSVLATAIGMPPRMPYEGFPGSWRLDATTEYIAVVSAALTFAYWAWEVRRGNH